MKFIALAMLVAIPAISFATTPDGDVSHRHIERLSDGRVAVVFDAPVCSDASDFLAEGERPVMPIERDGVLTASVIVAPGFANGSANCSGVSFTKIRADSFRTSGATK